MEFFGITLTTWIRFFAWSISCFTFLLIAKFVLVKVFSRLKNSSKDSGPTNDDNERPIPDKIFSYLQNIAQNTLSWILLLACLYLFSPQLNLPSALKSILDNVVIALLFVQLGFWLWRLIGLATQEKIKEAQKGGRGTITSVKTLGFLAKMALLMVILILVLDNFGINVMALITGLGVGGIAIALAAQNILKDFFASLTIVLDKPFYVQDFIATDHYKGTVENVGIKSTRLRSIDGEEIIIANSNLMDSRIHNYKRLSERRIIFEIGVVYETPLEKLEKIPQLLSKIIGAKEKLRLDRTHFKKFGDSALVFETVFYVLDPDYNLYMDLQQEVNLEIIQAFQAESLEFAYPTQVLYLNSP